MLTDTVWLTLDGRGRTYHLYRNCNALAKGAVTFTGDDLAKLRLLGIHPHPCQSCAKRAARDSSRKPDRPLACPLCGRPIRLEYPVRILRHAPIDPSTGTVGAPFDYDSESDGPEWGVCLSCRKIFSVQTTYNKGDGLRVVAVDPDPVDSWGQGDGELTREEGG